MLKTSINAGNYRTYTNLIYKVKEDTYYNYIQIKSLDLMLRIEHGDIDEVIDNNEVSIDTRLVDFSRGIGNIILAGHNNKKVFSRLHDSEIGNDIIIKYNEFYGEFAIEEIKVVEKEDVSIFKYTEDELILTLITCMKDNNYRKIIVAKYKSI